MTEDAINLAEAKCMANLQRCRQLSKSEPESAHGGADEALCEFLRALGYGHLVDEFDEVIKWYA